MTAPKTMFAKILDAGKWRQLFAAQTRLRAINRADDELDRQFSRVGKLSAAADEPYVVADGMWRNPNHFFRVRLFIEALHTLGRKPRLLGILRSSRDWRERRALARIGFEEFVYIEYDDEFRTDMYLAESRRLLSVVREHADILALQLPDDIPAYTYYDTVLKLSSNPRPPLDDPLWVSTLAETLRNRAIYNRELSKRPIMHVALSHPWKNEWATLVWLALKREIPVEHLTGFCEAMRIRRFRTADDYATPVEHVPRAVFEGLPQAAQRKLAEIGAADLRRRSSGLSSDLNVRHAFDPRHRIGDREHARAILSGQTERPVAIVYGHVWFDFPHTFAMRNFIDFRDWMELTLREIRDIDDVVWLLKPHPTEAWYGGFNLTTLARDLPPHVRLLPMHTDSQTTINAADTIVTVHGTVGLEAAAAGVAVILGDRSYYSGWGVAHAAADRADYVRLLHNAGQLPRPDAAARARANACFALALAEPDDGDALPMSCDSTGLALYKEIAGRYDVESSARQHEVESIAAFLDQSEIDSFAAYRLVQGARGMSNDLGASALHMPETKRRLDHSLAEGEHNGR